VNLARMHRRLAAAMALAALAAFVAGAGWEPATAATGAVLAVTLVWLPPAGWNRWIERVARVVLLALFAWAAYVAFVLVADFMPAVMAMLLFLLATESIRPLEAQNDARLYMLAAALFVGATAFYPGIAFAVAFVAFVVLATLAMMVGFLRRQAERFGTPGVRVGRGFLAATVGLCALTLAVSLGVFLVFPRLPRQWNVQGRPGGGDVMAGFGDEVYLGQHGGSIQPNPEIVFRVEYPNRVPVGVERTFWRGRSFDRFDGLRWSRTPTLFAADLAPGAYLRRWGGLAPPARVFGGPPGARVLFTPHPVVAVSPRSAIRYSREPAGDLVFFGSDAPVYDVVSSVPAPPERLLRASAGADPVGMSAYLQLPRLQERVQRLADSLAAGHDSRLDHVRAVEGFLHTEFSYSLDLPRSRADASIDAFLFRRREGHCEYFSTAMAVLLRAGGVPVRNVTGFAGGEWNRFGSYLAVTGNNAHSWVEVWFPEVGWVTFDPTPPSREGVVRWETGGGWTWPLRFWFNALEHRWYKWVLDYNLDKQLSLFRDVGDFFSPAGSRTSAPGQPLDARRLLPLLAALAAAGLLVLGVRVRRGTPAAPETRTYLRLRRSYRRAGFDGRAAAGPVAFAEALRETEAPGAGPASQAVDLYVRARFGGRPPDDALREALDAAAAEAREALRASRRARRQDGRPRDSG
jgi:protein-glutamine gamma-glutamyltransferase